MENIRRDLRGGRKNGSHGTFQLRRCRPHQIVRPLVRAGPGRLHACLAHRLLLHASETRLLRIPAFLLYAPPLPCVFSVDQVLFIDSRPLDQERVTIEMTPN
ncbi:hypothetical protein TNCV_1790251 [Trichonephila clavipes]|nr:hypothetical protein TNCV_1790251 [Trichonephila clavipes]